MVAGWEEFLGFLRSVGAPFLQVTREHVAGYVRFLQAKPGHVDHKVCGNRFNLPSVESTLQQRITVVRLFYRLPRLTDHCVRSWPSLTVRATSGTARRAENNQKLVPVPETGAVPKYPNIPPGARIFEKAVAVWDYVEDSPNVARASINQPMIQCRALAAGIATKISVTASGPPASPHICRTAAS